MYSPTNLILAAFTIIVICGYGAAMQSPDALEVLAKKMRARARAMRASKQAWDYAYEKSIRDDEIFNEDRDMLMELVRERKEFDAMVRPE